MTGPGGDFKKDTFSIFEKPKKFVPKSSKIGPWSARGRKGRSDYHRAGRLGENGVPNRGKKEHGTRKALDDSTRLEGQRPGEFWQGGRPQNKNLAGGRPQPRRQSSHHSVPTVECSKLAQFVIRSSAAVLPRFRGVPFRIARNRTPQHAQLRGRETSEHDEQAGDHTDTNVDRP